ncbi:TetR/AcrR family transcriptional regulator [Lacrimispora sp. 38-1]|uniref:TetR/AcrR family transcriptional regulator n=1 Tax=Lacrimispora sp. 38-1 TaxID=3125778 RepID=UPI003CE75B90
MQIYENAREKTRKKIVEAFWRAYKRKPIEKITVKSITDDCQMHRATFYLHYKDVYAVLEEIEDMLIQSLEQISREYFETARDLDNYAKALFKIFHDNGDYLHDLVIENKQPLFALKYKNKLKSIFPNVFRSKSNDSKTNLAINMTISVFVDMFIQWADTDVFSAEEMLSMTKGFMVNGIFPTLLEDFEIEPVIDLRSDRYRIT